MARVVVVGGGFGGQATAARLAKVGHDVTILERSATMGGALSTVSEGGFTWDSGASYTLLPAVVRDLFRKTGRTLEQELGTDLTPLELVREHRFEDRTSIRLPGGSRAAQESAFEELGPGLGRLWTDYVDSYSEVWDVLRRAYFEAPWQPDALPKEVATLVDNRAVLYKHLRKTFRDDRPAMVAGHPFVAAGHDLRNVPTWAGLETYLEQCFGAWTVPGGLARIGLLLEARLATRAVTVLTETEARDLVVREGRVAAVSTTTGEVAADIVVCAVDPRRLPALAAYVARSMPAIPPVIAYLGLEGDLPDLPHEVVFHGDPMLVIRTGGTAPEGCAAWTLHGRGRLAEDMLSALARSRIDIRDNVVVRLDRSPRDLVDGWGGSPHGLLWQGRGTVRHRLGPTTPIAGVYAAGAHAAPGAGIAFVGLSAALVAQVVGPA